MKKNIIVAALLSISSFVSYADQIEDPSLISYSYVTKYENKIKVNSRNCLPDEECYIVDLANIEKTIEDLMSSSLDLIQKNIALEMAKNIDLNLSQFNKS